MDSHTQLNTIAKRLEAEASEADLHAMLDEVEFLYDTLAPEFQDLADDLIARLHRRLRDGTRAS